MKLSGGNKLLVEHWHFELQVKVNSSVIRYTKGESVDKFETMSLLGTFRFEYEYEI